MIRSGCIPLVAACLALAGCGEEAPARHPPLKALAHERDSVTALCRATLSTRPGDVDAQLLLGSTLLREYMARAGSAGGYFAGVFFLYSTPLNDFGTPADSSSIAVSRSILREAGEHLATAHALAPENAGALKELGLLAITSWPATNGYPAYDTAAAMFARALARDSGDVDAYDGLASCALNRHEDGRAIALLRRSLQRDSSRGSTYLTMGNAYMDSGMVPLAFACWESAVQLGLETPAEYIQIARRYTDEVAESRMIGKLAYLRREAPRFFRPLIRGALNLVGMYHPAIALRLAATALEVDSTCAQAYLFRGEVFLEEGDTAAASDELVAAMRLGTAPYYAYAGFPARMYEEAIGQCEYRPVLPLLVGTIYTRTADSRRGLRYLRKAVGDLPMSAAAAYQLGKGILAAGDTAEAYRWFTRAIELPPAASAEMYWDLPRLFMRRDQIGNMVLAYQKMNAIIEQPLIVEEYQREGTARLYTREELRLAASYCSAGYDCAWAIKTADGERLQRHAIELFTRAHELTPASGIPYVGLGDLFIDAGNPNEALRYFRMAAAKGNPDAKVRVKELTEEISRHR